MLDQPEFGLRLRQLRVDRGLSQSSLADGALSTGYLSRLESGVRPPTRRIVERLAERLEVPVTAFDAAGAEGSEIARLVALAASTVVPDDAPLSGESDEAADPSEGGIAEALDAALSAGEGDPASRWHARWIVAHTRRAQRRTEDELRLFTELADTADGMDVPELRVRSRAELSRTLAAAGRFVEARESAEQALALAPGGVDRLAALHALVSAEAGSGRLAEAREHADELLETAADAGIVEHVKALWAAAAVRARQADDVGARQLLESALAELESRADVTLWLRLRLAAASLHLQAADPLLGEVRAWLDEAEPAVGLVGTALHRAQLRALRARLAYEEGRYAEAGELAGHGQEHLKLLSFQDGLRLQALRARLRMHAGEVEAGTRETQELASRAQEALNVNLAAEIWRDLARTVSTVHAPAAPTG